MTSLNLPATMSEGLEEIAHTLQCKSRSEIVLVADISGQLILEEGQVSAIDPAIVAALGAGQLTAMKELGRQVGDPDPSGNFLHESGYKRIYLCSVAESFVVIVVFTKDVPVGLVRLHAQRAVAEMQVLVTEFESWIDNSDSFYEEWNTDSVKNEEFDAAFSEAFDETFEEF